MSFRLLPARNGFCFVFFFFFPLYSNRTIEFGKESRRFYRALYRLANIFYFYKKENEKQKMVKDSSLRHLLPNILRSSQGFRAASNRI